MLSFGRNLPARVSPAELILRAERDNLDRENKRLKRDLDEKEDNNKKLTQKAERAEESILNITQGHAIAINILKQKNDDIEKENGRLHAEVNNLNLENIKLKHELELLRRDLEGANSYKPGYERVRKACYFLILIIVLIIGYEIIMNLQTIIKILRQVT